MLEEVVIAAAAAALTVKAAKACMEAMNRTLCYFIDSHVILREQQRLKHFCSLIVLLYPTCTEVAE